MYSGWKSYDFQKERDAEFDTGRHLMAEIKEC